MHNASLLHAVGYKSHRADAARPLRSMSHQIFCIPLMTCVISVYAIPTAASFYCLSCSNFSQLQHFLVFQASCRAAKVNLSVWGVYMICLKACSTLPSPLGISQDGHARFACRREEESQGGLCATHAGHDHLPLATSLATQKVSNFVCCLVHLFQALHSC